MKFLKRLALAGLLALGGLVRPYLPAEAATTTTIDSITTYATYHNVGVRVYYTGDDDSDAVFTGFVWKPNVTNDSTSVKDTLVFYDNRKTLTTTSTQTRRFRSTSIMWNGQDTTVKFDVMVTDADGCTNCPKASPGYLSNASWNPNPGYGSVQTWAAPNQDGVGAQVFVGPYGDDSNSGADAAHPKRSLNAARDALGAAGQIRLLTGNYQAERLDTLYISPDSKNGTGPNARYSIVGDVGVVISGADTSALSQDVWICKDLTGVGSVFGYACDFSSRPIYPRVITIGDTTRLYPYQTLARLAADPLGVVTNHGAYWVAADGKTVIIRPKSSFVDHGQSPGDWLTNNSDDSSLPIRVARKAALIRIQSSFWRVDSLTFRDFGTGIMDVALRNPVVSFTNQGNLIENCTFINCGRPAIAASTYFDVHDKRTHALTIQKNIFKQYTFGQTWRGPADLVGYDLMANQGCTAADTNSCGEQSIIFPTILIECGRGHVIRWNTVRGGPDSFVRTTTATNLPDTAAATSRDTDVYQNDLMNLGDDVIEPDATPGYNWRVYKNLIRGGHTAMNYYIANGPFYFVYNTIINVDGMLLPRGADAAEVGISAGHLIVANNTYKGHPGAGGAVLAAPQNGATNQYRNLLLAGNLLIGKSSTIYDAGCLNLNSYGFNGFYVLSGTGFSNTNYGGVLRAQTQLTAMWDSLYTTSAKKDRWFTGLSFQDTLTAGKADYAPKSTWTKVFKSTATDTAGRSMPGINTNIKHAVSSWKNNTSNSSDSTYIGAWKVNGMALEGLIPDGSVAATLRRGWFFRFLHLK